MYRTKDFTPFVDLPETPAKGAGAQRDFYTVVRREQRDAIAKCSEVDASEDLTPDAKARKKAEIHREARGRIAEAHKRAEALTEEGIAKLEAGLEHAMAPAADSSPLPANLDPGQRAVAERMARVERLLVRQAAVPIIERCLAGDAGALERELRAVLTHEEPAIRAWIETRGIDRILTEGSEAQRQIAELVVGEVRQSRLGESGVRALDHVDALRMALAAATAVMGDVGAPSFFESPGSPGLSAATQLVGALAAPPEEE